MSSRRASRLPRSHLGGQHKTLPRRHTPPTFLIERPIVWEQPSAKREYRRSIDRALGKSVMRFNPMARSAFHSIRPEAMSIVQYANPDIALQIDQEGRRKQRLIRIRDILNIIAEYTDGIVEDCPTLIRVSLGELNRVRGVRANSPSRVMAANLAGWAGMKQEYPVVEEGQTIGVRRQLAREQRVYGEAIEDLLQKPTDLETYPRVAVIRKDASIDATEGVLIDQGVRQDRAWPPKLTFGHPVMNLITSDSSLRIRSLPLSKINTEFIESFS